MNDDSEVSEAELREEQEIARAVADWWEALPREELLQAPFVAAFRAGMKFQSARSAIASPGTTECLSEAESRESFRRAARACACAMCEMCAMGADPLLPPDDLGGYRHQVAEGQTVACRANPIHRLIGTKT